MQPYKQVAIGALVSYKIYPAQFGGQKGIALFYRYVAKLIPIHIFTVQENTESEAGITLHHTLASGFLKYLSIFSFFKIKKLVKKLQLSHLIIEHPYLGWLGYLLKKSCGISIIIHSHNIEALRFKSNGKWWWKILWHYEKWVHQQADINFFITENDKAFAINHYKVSASVCHVITYGTVINIAPTVLQTNQAKDIICAQHQINSSDTVLLFNGTLDYLPNIKAIDFIVNELNPILLKAPLFKYKIIVCGKNLPASYNNLISYPNVLYTGFVADINVYFLGASIFINPVIDGGGIKTKLVEALAYNLSCISTQSGAIGVLPTDAGDKLIIVNDYEAESFAKAIVNMPKQLSISPLFFDKFYWGSIAKKAVNIMLAPPSPILKKREKI